MTLEEFEKEHGKINQFEGAILHPGARKQARCMEEVLARLPNKPILLATLEGPDDYERTDTIPFFSFNNTEGIYSYLTTYQERKK